MAIKANYKTKNYVKWVSDSGCQARRQTWPGLRCELSLSISATKPVLERLDNAFSSKNPSNLLNLTFLLSLPAQIPASAQLTQWDFGQERAGFSPKAPVLQLFIYLQKRPVGYPKAESQLGNSQEELEYLAVGPFWKLSINFLFCWLMVLLFAVR